jgi:hypothetical protein
MTIPSSSSCCATPDQARLQRDGAASPLPAAGAFRLRPRNRASSPSATARSARRAARSAIARRKTPRPRKTRSSSASPRRTAFIRRKSASSGPCSAARRRFRFPPSGATISANLRAVVQDPLTDAEMEADRRLDRNCRLIKGQVFCWKDNQSWEDLWDINGDHHPA